MKRHKIINQIFTKIKIPAFILAVLAATFASANIFTTEEVSAWGPTDRPTYTNKSPADYATFNSITDNVAVGDERNFVRIREAGTEDTFVDELEVIPGHEYEVYIYYHNNAATDTNAKGYGVATDVHVSSAYPTVVNTNERGMISGIITWSYVTPSAPNTPKEGTVWDEAYVTSKTDGVVLKYKTGTAIIHNSGDANGSVLSTDLFTNEGTPIGFNKLSGTLPGCAEYSGHITYTLVAENPGSELSKQVSLDGENWYDSVNAKPGDYVTYKVIFKNTGNTNFTNLILTDSHDEDLSLVNGTSKVFDYDHTDGYTIDDIIDLSGYNTGNIYAGAITQLVYQMRVKEGDSACNKKLNNTIKADYNSTESKTDNAEVVVVCDQTPPPSTTEDCNSNPNLPGCKTPDKIVETGPLEITMAVVVVLGIAAGGFYLWRTKRTLKTVEGVVSGDNNFTPTDTANGTPTDAQTTTPTHTPINENPDATRINVSTPNQEMSAVEKQESAASSPEAPAVEKPSSASISPEEANK